MQENIVSRNSYIQDIHICYCGIKAQTGISNWRNTSRFWGWIRLETSFVHHVRNPHITEIIFTTICDNLLVKWPRLDMKSTITRLTYKLYTSTTVIVRQSFLELFPGIFQNFSQRVWTHHSCVIAQLLQILFRYDLFIDLVMANWVCTSNTK